MFHKVKSVQALPGMQLSVEFVSGERKRYDMTPVLQRWEQFQALKLPGLFENVKVDAGGFGIAWNDDLDLSCDELWGNGHPEGSCDVN